MSPLPDDGRRYLLATPPADTAPDDVSALFAPAMAYRAVPVTGSTDLTHRMAEAHRAGTGAAFRAVDDEPLKDWTEITIRTTREVRCPIHGVLGHATRGDEARSIRDRHWNEQHRSPR